MKKGLGRGLDAIFESGSLPERRIETSELDIAVISPNPDQPRRFFDHETLQELADSIAALGVIQPITVMSDGEGGYIIVSGERRWRAAQMAGLETIPVYIRETNDQAMHEMALVENIQREDLNPMEVARSMQRLIDECGLTQELLSERIGKKRTTIANYLRLLSLPPQVQVALAKDLITMGHAKAIAGAQSADIPFILRKTVDRGLSVRQVEDMVARGRAPRMEEEREFPDSYARLVELLEGIFSSDISIKPGKIVIRFEDGDVERFISSLSEK